MLINTTKEMEQELEKLFIASGNLLLQQCQESMLNDKDVVYIHRNGNVYTEEYLESEYKNSLRRDYLMGYNDAMLGFQNDAIKQARLDNGYAYFAGMKYAEKHEKCATIKQHYLSA